MNQAKWYVAAMLIAWGGGNAAMAAQAPAQTPAASTEISSNTWSGPLVDMGCKDRNIADACPVSANTERFGLSGDGGILLPFDAAGNEKAKAAVAAGGYAGNVEVTVVGDRDGSAFKVQSLKIEQ